MDPEYLIIESADGKPTWFNICLFNIIDTYVINRSLVHQSIEYKVDDNDFKVFSVDYNNYITRHVVYGIRLILKQYTEEEDPANQYDGVRIGFFSITTGNTCEYNGHIDGYISLEDMDENTDINDDPITPVTPSNPDNPDNPDNPNNPNLYYQSDILNYRIGDAFRAGLSYTERNGSIATDYTIGYCIYKIVDIDTNEELNSAFKVKVSIEATNITNNVLDINFDSEILGRSWWLTPTEGAITANIEFFSTLENWRFGIDGVDSFLTMKNTDDTYYPEVTNQYGVTNYAVRKYYNYVQSTPPPQLVCNRYFDFDVIDPGDNPGSDEPVVNPTVPFAWAVVDHTNYHNVTTTHLADYYIDFPTKKAAVPVVQGVEDHMIWPTNESSMFPIIVVNWEFQGIEELVFSYQGTEFYRTMPSATIQNEAGETVQRKYYILSLPQFPQFAAYEETDAGNPLHFDGIEYEATCPFSVIMYRYV